MAYRITIVRTDPNPNFAEEVEKWERERRYITQRFEDHVAGPKEEIAQTALVCELTDEQYKKVQEAVLARQSASPTRYARGSAPMRRWDCTTPTALSASLTPSAGSSVAAG